MKFKFEHDSETTPVGPLGPQFRLQNPILTSTWSANLQHQLGQVVKLLSAAAALVAVRRLCTGHTGTDGPTVDDSSRTLVRYRNGDIPTSRLNALLNALSEV
jgi:hypothetical protein